MAFSFYRTVTIDHTKVASTQTDFPVLVSVALGDLATVANGGVVTSASAFDVVFASNTAGTTKLKWEVEKYDPATGLLVAWVKIASLSSSADTVIYLCYGDSGVTTFQGDVNGTWDANFKGVYHLSDQGGTLGLADSTANGKTMDNHNGFAVTATGKVGGAAQFTALVTGGDIYNTTFGNVGFPLTFECWVQIPATGVYRAFIANNSGTNDGVYLGCEPGNKFEYVRPGFAEHVFSSLASVTANTWYYVVMTISAAGTALIAFVAVAGGSLASQSITVPATIGGTPIYLFLNGVNTSSVNGAKLLDECRVSNVVRSADWIGTCFKNQDSPSTFLAVGTATPNVTDFPQSRTIAQTVGVSATEAAAAPASGTAAASVGVSATEVLNALESASVAVSVGVSASPVTGAPESVAAAVSVGVTATQEVQGGNSAPIHVAAEVAGAGAMASAAQGSAAAQVDVVADGVAGHPASGTASVAAEVAAIVTASRSAAVPVSVGVSATAKVNAPKSVSIGAEMGVAVEGSQFVAADSIPSRESWGTPNVAGPVQPGSIPSGESWGTPYLNASQTVSPATIASAEAWGTVRVANVRTVRPGSIASAESWGTPVLSVSNRPVFPGSIPSGESWGTVALTGGVQTLQVFVGNYDRSRWTRRGTASFTSQTLGRWSGSIEFENIPDGDKSALDTEDEWTPQHGQTILVKEYNRTLFRGCIKNIKTSRPLSTDLVVYSCQLGDKTSICDRRRVRRGYPAVSDNIVGEIWDVADVVRDILANYLDGEGIMLDPAFPLSLGDLTAPLSPFITVTQAFDALRDLTGLQWFINLTQVLRFIDTAAGAVAPFEITETSRNWRNISTEISDADYRNRQYVISNRKIAPTGGGAAGSSRVEPYTMLDFGTGHLPVFPDHIGYQAEAIARGFEPGGYIVVGLPIASVTKVRVNTVEIPVYQEAQLTEAILFGSDPWWAYFPNTDFVWPHFFVNAGDVVEISYTPLSAAAGAQTDPLLVVEQPFDPPPGEKFGTCGSGRYDAVEQVNDVDTQDGLDAIAAGLLARSGVIPRTVTFETDYPGLEVGQKLHVDVIRQLLDNLDMFITGLNGKSNPDGIDLGQGSSFRWTVTATNFPDLGNWKKVWERLWRRTAHPVPVDRVVAATIVLAPGAALAAGSNFTNPGKINETGQLSEVIARFEDPPVDQDLVLDVTLDGISIFNSGKLVIPAGFADDVILTDFARANLWAYKNQTVKVSASYRVTGPAPIAARSGTVVLRTNA